MRSKTLHIFLAIAILCVPVCTFGKSYRFDRIAVDAEVTSDGTLRIDEELTYIFNGSFSFAYRDIPLKRGETISNIRVREGAERYTPATTESPSTFVVAERSDGVRITWYYRASDERRSFHIAYAVNGVVKRYADVGELYYKFVGDEIDRTVGEVLVRVVLPDGVERSQVQAWVHGPVLVDGEVTINPDATVAMDVSRLPRYTYWEGRILFPAAALGSMALTSDEPRRPTVEAAERQWAVRANELRDRQIAQREQRRARREMLRERARVDIVVAVVVAVFGLLLWFGAFRRHGRPHDVKSRTARGDIPSEHRPAIVSYLLYRNVGGPAIVATLLDMAARGYFNIRETVTEKSSFFGKRKKTDYRFERTDKLWKDLEPFELELAEFLITEVGDITGFTMSGLKKTASKNRTKFLKWFRAWIKSVKEAGKTFDFYEPYPKRAMVMNGVLGLAVALVGGALCAHSQSPAGVPAIIGGMLVLILTTTLTRHTVEGRRLVLAWRDFKKHLKNVSRGMGRVSLDSREWSQYLGAAIIFGMHKKLLPKISQSSDGSAFVPVWYYGAIGQADGIGSLADGLTTMVTSVSTTMSSASGAGGGASVGGGGGSGGGGAGAG